MKILLHMDLERQRQERGGGRRSNGGSCPAILGEYISSAPLIPLLKPGGGRRPIVVGTIWRRLCSKLDASSVCKDMTRYLGNHQFGVGIPCDSEGTLHSANNLLEFQGSQNNVTMLLVDFSNDFNLVDRTALLTEGDPLGPLLFALILHPLVNKIATECTLDLHAWYLDNGTLIGDTMEVSKDLRIIQDEGPARGLHLNISKTEIFWPSVDPRRDMIGVFPTNISKPTRGVKILGGPVSMDLQFCSNMVVDRVEKTNRLMHNIKKLQDPQSKLLLLRRCTGVSRLFFTMRTTTPLALQAATTLFDKQLLQYLRQLIVRDGAGFGIVQQRLATMPIKDGGLGVYTMADTSQYCFLASCAQAQHLQSILLQGNTTFDSSQRYQQALQVYTQTCGSSPSQFNINDDAPHFMKSMAATYFDVIKKELPTKYSLSARDIDL
ncbi:uncharacterized protein LOC113295887 [Papaver somniferum]|uniref:uncharacterized protein LOC113295887 n=1 Tax=Papaver somniferum TaxID=3469 RepID=UPI000E6FDEB2|nr:uncharacterized protein LOC113295887 [Papaver somniferum]